MTERPVLMFEPLGRGGIADYTDALATALAASGTPVELVTAADHLYDRRPGVELVGLVPWLRARGGVSRALRRARLAPVVNAVRFLATMPRLVRRARGARLVHVQGFYFPPLLVVAVAVLRAAGATIVHTPHNTFDRGRAHRLARALLARAAARTIVHVQADLPALPAEANPAVIPHGEYGSLARAGGAADPAAARAGLGLADGELIVLHFGQLRTDKGIGDLLQAAARVEGVHVVLAGEELGALRAAAGEVREAVGGGRLTVVEGFQPIERAAALFAAADVVALPYRRASQSGVLLLAYGFERPVAVYPVGGLPEAVVDGETGWVCKAASPASLASVLADAAALGREECRRRGQAGRRFSEQRYAWDAIARRTAALYDEVSP